MTGEAVNIKETDERSSQVSTDVIINGATFEIITDRVWKIPTLTDKTGTMINIALRITNRTGTGMRFHKFDTIRIALISPDGKSLLFDGGRNATRPGEFISPLILPEQSLIISRQAKLVWLKDKILRLIGSDDFGGIWYFDGLGPGNYKVQIIHENYKAKIGFIDSIWIGKVITRSVEVELKQL
ncbi:MAG: hypothetical protein JRE64_09055 [Deltaproteobacteria bacterium]|nr:hypothetical protein [Deltaproteobacteria bacterium]